MNVEQLTEFVRARHRDVMKALNRAVRIAGQEPDERELMERAEAGQRARTMLESPLFMDFMARSEANLTTALLELPLDADKERRNLAVAIQTQRQWVHYLHSLTGDGKSAQQQLERLASGRKGML